MANVTGELKEFFSCEDLKGKFFKLGAKKYFLKLKNDINTFLMSNKKMQAKKKKAEEPPNSDTYNNLKNFADILNNPNVYQICRTAELLPKFVLDTGGKKKGKISLRASIKKVSKDIEKWVKTLESILSEIKPDLYNIKEHIEIIKNGKHFKIKMEEWEKISSRFKKSGIGELEGIAYQIDNNITGKSMASQSLLCKNWCENETIENLIEKFSNN